MPRVDEALDSIGQAQPQYFSTLDLRSGYWQIVMDEESKDLTAFCSSVGLHAFKKMPFGQKGSLSTFQRLMSDLFRSMNWKNVLIYLDDIIIFSKSFSQHFEHIEEVLVKLRQADLRLKPQKCHFACQEVQYLGHRVSTEGIRPDPDKCAAIQKARRPHNVRTVRAFLGLCNYYRKFIKGHSAIARPLHKLLQRDAPFQWTTDCEKAFQTLKEKLITPPILGYPDFNKAFKLYTDASGEAVGAILSQEQNGVERVIVYSGRAMNKHEQNYGITEKEALAVITGIKNFDPYLRNNKFTIITDHSALKWLFCSTRGEPMGRLGRWTLLLQQYDFEVVHRAGLKHQTADGLSRGSYDPHPADDTLEDVPLLFTMQSRLSSHDKGRDTGNPHQSKGKFTNGPTIKSHTQDRHAPVPDCHTPPDTTALSPTSKPQQNGQHQSDHTINMPLLHALQSTAEEGQTPDPKQNFNFPEITKDELIELQGEDPYCQPLLAFKRHEALPQDDKFPRKLVLEAEDYVLIEGLLHHLWYPPGKGPKEERVVQQLVLPLKLRERVLSSLHDHTCAGHYGIARTGAVVHRQYFWRHQLDDIASWIKSCRHCAQKKGAKEKHRAPLCPMPIVGAFQRWNIDCIGPLPTTVTGNKYIVLATDSLTKWPVAEATADIKAQTIAKVIFDRVVTVYGTPRTLFSDRGSNFLGAIIRHLCDSLGTRKINTSSYHPATNGQNERLNRVLYNSLSAVVSQKADNWDEFLQASLFAYRITPSAETTNASPYQLLFGQQPTLPIDSDLQLPENPPASLSAHLQHNMEKVQLFRELTASQLEANKAKMKKAYDKKASETNLR